jgi:hypothetical protein
LLFALEVHGAHATECFFALDPLLLAGLEHLLVFDPKLTALDVEPVQGDDDGVGISCSTEVGEGEATEGTGPVQMVVERIRGRDR